MGRHDYRPSRFMLPTSHFDREKGERAVRFIEMLKHTKGKWAGKRFRLLDWQYDIVMDIFGIVKEDGNRQFRTAYVEIGKKNGKSELARRGGIPGGLWRRGGPAAGVDRHERGG